MAERQRLHLSGAPVTPIVLATIASLLERGVDLEITGAAVTDFPRASFELGVSWEKFLEFLRTNNG